MQAQKVKYYDDGITKITDPFWTVICPDCGYQGWSLTYAKGCQICGSMEATYSNTNIKNSPSS